MRNMRGNIGFTRKKKDKNILFNMVKREIEVM